MHERSMMPLKKIKFPASIHDIRPCGAANGNCIWKKAHPEKCTKLNQDARAGKVLS